MEQVTVAAGPAVEQGDLADPELMPAARERQLLLAAQAGDPESFGEIVAHYYRHLLRQARAANQRCDREDAVQTAFLKAMREGGLDELDVTPEHAGVRWLTAVVRNAALDLRKYQAVASRGRPSGLMRDEKADGPIFLASMDFQASILWSSEALSPEEVYFRQFDAELAVDALRTTLDQLDERQREIVRLKFVAGLTNEDIAKRLGMSNANAVKSAVARIYRRVRRLEQEGVIERPPMACGQPIMTPKGNSP